MVNDGAVYEACKPIPMIIGAFTAVAWYNCIEVNVILWKYFKIHKGLYFYSVLVSSIGIFLHALGLLLSYFDIFSNRYIALAISSPGWYAMVTGQSMVLYSRLNLVMYDDRKLKWVLYMIIIDAFLFHVPTSVFTFGANSPRANFYNFPYFVMEKIQISGFSLQEFILSGFYVYYTWKLLKPVVNSQRRKFRQVMRDLILVNVLVILMDITLLVTECIHHYEIQTTYKSLVYSVKLKLEFAILNQLIYVTRGEDRKESMFSERSSAVDRAGRSPGDNGTAECCFAEGREGEAKAGRLVQNTEQGLENSPEHCI